LPQIALQRGDLTEVAKDQERKAVMKRAKGLAKIPVIVTLLVLAAGGASFHSKAPVVVEESDVVVTNAPAPASEVPLIGSITVTASRAN
jgi:hypothetical protein